MKLDKESVIVILIVALLIGAWAIYYPRNNNLQQNAETPAEQNAEQTVPVQPNTAVQSKPVPVEQAQPAPAAKAKAYTIENDEVAYTFSSLGNIDSITLKKFKRTGSTEPIVLPEPDFFAPLKVDLPGWKNEFAGIKKNGKDTLELKKICNSADGSRFELIQSFTLDPKSAVIKSVITMQSAKTGIVVPQAVVWSGTMAPLMQMSGDKVMRDVHQVEYSAYGSHKVTIADPNAKPEKFLKNKTGEPLEWVAVSNKYFLSIVTTAAPFNGGCELQNEQIAADDATYPMPKIGGIYRNIKLPARFEISCYSGIKDMNRMAELPQTALGAIHLAYWRWLEPICRPMLWLLNKLKALTGSYGLAIILLTVLVKLALWPLIHKGNKSMRKLQKLQPIMKELKEKYKDNQQEFSAKMAELYRKEKVNPLGGCFPMLIQIPIFIALYSTLDSAVELRHVPFLWATDLSRPDLVGPVLFAGIGIHPLIIISTALTVLQMKLTPSAGDPAQQKMMMIMPIMMLFFFYNFPSGLALYWTVNNILSILQMKYSQYSAAKEEAKEASKQKAA